MLDGAVAQLEKPFRFEDLLRLLEKHLIPSREPDAA
jgi:hypothetical protein